MGRGAGKIRVATGRPGPARFALPAEERDFNLHRRDGLVLIIPRATKMSRSDWPDEEIVMRSLVLREATGEVVSASFPKFFNWGESGSGTERLSPEDKILASALEAGEPVYFTEKLDGSLAIRSVIDGQVVYRSRGTLDPDSDHVRAMRAAAARYPRLADPEFEPGRSLLFEFISPNFRIILPYEKDELILLGAVDHSSMRLADVPELERLAAEAGTPLVGLVELPTEPDALIAAVKELKGEEGIVARAGDGQTLVKLKSAEYLAMHRLRFGLTIKSLRALCNDLEVRKLEDFEAYLHSQQADWELVHEAKPLVEMFISASAETEQTFAELKSAVAAKAEELPERKDFAVRFAVPLGGSRTTAAFALLEGREEDAFRALHESALDLAFADVETTDNGKIARFG